MTKAPEVWMPITGYEGIYEVSSFGRISVLKNGERFIRKQNSATHYLSVSFKKRLGDKTQRSEAVHRLVAQAFLGPRPDGHIVRHIDGNRYNNKVENLCYGTPQENVYDTVRHKTHQGENNGNCILNEISVKAIKLLIKHNVSQSEIAKTLGVTVSTIHAIKKGKNWGHIPSP
jgi:DNA-binding XRE family transcriptional regulator